MQPPDNTGLITLSARHSVNETVAKIRTLLDQRHIPLFALIDHAAEAAKVGLTMPPTQLLIFGNPKAGTPLMLAAPTTALDLPLKLLIWQHPDGQTRLTYTDPAHLQSRHHFPPDLLPNLTLLQTLAEQADQ